MLEVFNSRTAKILGQRSSVDPAALEKGFWLKLENLTGNRFKVTKRWGAAMVGSSAPVANAEWRGGWAGYLDGVLTCVCAFSESNDVHLYSLNLSSYAWTKITDGTTYFDTVGFVEFAAMHDPGNVSFPDGKDILLCGNGLDPNIVIRKNGSGTLNQKAAVSALSLPTATIATVQPYPECWFEIQDPANVTYPTHTGAFNGTPPANSSATAGENECAITMDTSTSGTLEIAIASATQLGSADYQTSTSSGAFDLVTANGSSHYVALLVEDTISDPVFDYVGVSLRDGTTYRPVWSLAAVGKPLPLYLPVADGVYLVVFDLSLYRDTLSLYINMDRVKIEVDHALPASRTFNIIGVYGLGAVPAGANYAVSLQNDTTFVESGVQVCRKIEGPLPRDLGGNKTRNFNLIEGSAGQNIGWTYIVRINKPVSGTSVIIYRNDPIDEKYFHTGLYSTTSTDSPFAAKHDRVEGNAKFFRRVAPSSQNVPPPKGDTLASVGGRMYVGGILNNRSQVWISDLNYPLRFTEIPRDEDLNGNIDEDSGAVANFPGERVYRLVSLPGSVAGIQPVIVFTNKGMWRLEGFDSLSLSTPTYLNAHGTIYKWTVAIHKRSIYYLDAEKQPRVYAGGSEPRPLGIWKVEDQFETGDCWNAHGFVFKERYYIGIRDVSETLKRKYVFYEELTDEWWTHKYTTPDFAWNFVQQVLGTDSGSFSTANGSKLIGVTNAGKVYELEQSGKLVDDLPTTGTEAITVEMKTFLLGDGWNNYEWGQPGVVWEKSTGGELTVTLDTPHDETEDGAVRTGTLDLENGVADEAWRFFVSEDEIAHPGVQGYGCYLTITGTPTSGKFCRAIILNDVRKIGGIDGSGAGGGADTWA